MTIEFIEALNQKRRWASAWKRTAKLYYLAFKFDEDRVTYYRNLWKKERTMNKLLTRLAIACVILAILGTIILVYTVHASAPGWLGNCRVAPAVDYDGELYRVRCANGVIRQVDGVVVEPVRPTWSGPTPERATWEPEPYPAPIATPPNPYP